MTFISENNSGRLWFDWLLFDFLVAEYRVTNIQFVSKNSGEALLVGTTGENTFSFLSLFFASGREDAIVEFRCSHR